MLKYLSYGTLSVLLALAGYNFIYRAYLTNTTKHVIGQVENLDAAQVFAECLSISPRTPGSRETVVACTQLFESTFPRKTKTITGATVWPFPFLPDQVREVYKNLNQARATYKLSQLPPLETLTNGAVQPAF